jgi:predicted MFS family arabinose efflux permease
MAAVASFALLPPLRVHLQKSQGSAPPPFRPVTSWAYLLALLIPAPGVLLLSNLPIYLTRNMGFPRADLSWLFLITGLLGFIALHAMGWVVDRFGIVRVATYNMVAMAAVIVASLILPVLSPLLLSVLLEMTVVPRNVPFSTMITKVPQPLERGRFMALQVAAQNIGGAAAGYVGARILSTGLHQELVGMKSVAAVTIVVGAAAPALMAWVERLRGREAASLPAAEAIAQK